MYVFTRALLTLDDVRTRVLVLDEADRMMTNLTLKKDMGKCLIVQGLCQ
jgi:superfamily II DNA/RNA helicase